MLQTFAALDFGVPLIFLLLIGLAILVFEVVMFVSVIQNEFITTNTRWLWAIGMLFIHPFVAIAYYFTDYKKVV